MKMDKLLNSRWFVKIVALFLALMLYAGVNMDTTVNSTPTPIFSPQGSEDYEALSNVPLIAYYDREQYAISDLPQSVTVYLEGPSGTITTTKMQEGYEVYLDMQNLKPGKHKVRVQHKGFSNRLNVKTEPSIVTVEIQEKVAQIMPVEIDYLNRDKIAEGYTAEQPIKLPNSVTVTGAKDQVQKIGFVKGFVDVEGANQTVEKNIPLKVYDQNGEVLNLNIEPSVVEVKVPIIAPNKTVPVIISRNESVPKGLSIKSFEVIPNEVTIYGPEEEVGSIEYIDDLSIDLSTVTEDTTRKISIPNPKGIKKVNPSSIEVKIDVEPEEKKEISNIPVKVIGLPDSMDVSFVSPSMGVADLSVYGASSVLANLSRSDFHVVLNLSEYVQGRHKLDLEVFGPQDVRWELSNSKAVIEIK